MDQSAKPRFVLFTPEISDARAFAPLLAAACGTADVAAVVLTLAPADDVQRLARIAAVEPAVHKVNASLLLAGLPHLVASAGADGAFVDGADVTAARRAVMNDHAVGAGRLDTRHDAMTAAESGADFVLFGDANADGKRPTMPLVIERVTWWAELFVVPCLAYAATSDEINPLVRAGADFIALGEEIVWSATDPAAALAAAQQHLHVEEHA